MKRLEVRMLLVVLVLISVLVGCQSVSDSPASGEVALKVTGLVNTELGLSEADVKKMDTLDAEYTNKDGESKTYTGVSVNALLDKAGVKGDAAAVAFVAADGYSAEATRDEVQGCTDCIVAFKDEGGFTMVMPNFSGKLQVKDVIEIQVK